MAKFKKGDFVLIADTNRLACVEGSYMKGNDTIYDLALCAMGEWMHLEVNENELKIENNYGR